MSPDYQRLIRQYRLQPDPELWLRINYIHYRHRLPFVDKNLSPEPQFPEMLQWQQAASPTVARQLLKKMNRVRHERDYVILREDGSPVLFEQLSPGEAQSLFEERKSFWEEGRLAHRGVHEPGEELPSWGLTPEQFTQLTCKMCGRRFERDAAGGVSGGLVTFDSYEGVDYFHGYQDDIQSRTNSCFAKFLKQEGLV